MNAIKTLAHLVQQSYPAIKCRLDRAKQPNRSSFLDIDLHGYALVAEQRPDGSFGLTAGREMAYGEGADESYSDLASTTQRILALLESRAQTTSQLARQLQAMRNKRGLTQEELARRLGIEQSAISKIEKSRGESVSIRRLQEMIAALGGQLSIRVTFPDTGDTEELSLGTVLVSDQQENHPMQSTRDYTKFDVTINGVIEECLPKRKAIWKIIKHLIVACGVSPEDISARLPWRGNRLFSQSVEGKVSAAEFVALMAQIGKNFDATRYFCQRDADLFFVNGKTTALSNQWGRRSGEAIQTLLAAFPNSGVSCKTC